MLKLSKVIMIFCLMISITGIAHADFNDIRQSDLYPAEYSISVEMNPDKDRDWEAYEVSNSLQWKFEDKIYSWMPSGFKLTIDCSPDIEDDWKSSAISGGFTWQLK